MNERKIFLTHNDFHTKFDIDQLRDKWFRTSYLLDRRQSGEKMAKERFDNYMNHSLKIETGSFQGASNHWASVLKGENERNKAAIIREKGVNGDREMAYALYLAGFDVKDVH